MKQLQVSYAEKQQALQEAKRRKGGNLLVADLNDVLNVNIMRNVKVYNSEYLKTLFIAVPNSSQVTFEETIESLGDTIAGYGGEYT